MNAETNQVVKGYEDLSTSNTIDLKGLNLKSYSILAKVQGSQANTVESIQFKSKVGTQIESFEHYALYGDDKGNYKGVAASKGKYTLNATAYSQDGAKGSKLAQNTLRYTIVDTTDTPTPTPKPPSIPVPKAGLITFELVNEETDKVIKRFNDLGTKHTLNPESLDLKQYSLVAKINPKNPQAKTVESVVFEGTAGDRTENVAPYASFGNIDTDYWGKNAIEGDYMMKATAYTKDGGSRN